MSSSLIQNFRRIVSDAEAAIYAAFAGNGGAALIGFLQAGLGAIRRTAEDKFRERVSVKDFGADPLGTATDNATAIQLALDSGATDLIFPDIYPCTSVTASSPIRLYGPGGFSRSAVASNSVLNINSSNVTVDGLTFTGSSEGTMPTGSSNSTDNAIEVIGVSTPTQLTNIKIINNKITGFFGFGVRANYCANVLINKNIIEYCGYCGIHGQSMINGIVTGNIVNYIEDSSGGDAYGISLSRDPTISLANAARSADCIVANNVISNVKTWTGIDCHAAYKSTITDNIVYSCANGIVVQYDSSSATYKAACEDLTIKHNTVYGRLIASENALGIASLGLTTMPNISIVISDNFVSGCGSYSATNGAVYVNETTDPVVTNNHISKSVRHAIGIKGTSSNFILKNNVINGVKNGDVVNSRSYLYLDLANISGVIEGNKFYNHTGDSAFNSYYGIWYSGATTIVVMDKNRISGLDTTSYLYDGTANTYEDFRWVLEDNSTQVASVALTAGNVSQVVQATTPRDSYGTFGVTKIAIVNMYPFAAEKITAVIKGTYDINEYEVTVYTVDGSTFGAAFNVSPLVVVHCVCWNE